MSGDILDLIDGAIDACETSVDAMRWTPDPTPPTAPGWSLLGFVERFLQDAYDSYPRELTPWQREVLAAPIPPSLPPLRVLPDLPPSLRLEYRQRAARLFDVPPELLR